MLLVFLAVYCNWAASSPTAVGCAANQYDERKISALVAYFSSEHCAMTPTLLLCGVVIYALFAHVYDSISCGNILIYLHLFLCASCLSQLKHSVLTSKMLLRNWSLNEPQHVPQLRPIV